MPLLRSGESVPGAGIFTACLFSDTNSSGYFIIYHISFHLFNFQGLFLLKESNNGAPQLWSTASNSQQGKN